MKILDNTDSRLAIEWLPWVRACGALALALLCSLEILLEAADPAAEGSLLFAASVLVTNFIYAMVYRYGQMARLTLDRASGTAHILSQTLVGTFHRTIPLREVHSASVRMISSQFPIRTVV